MKLNDFIYIHLNVVMVKKQDDVRIHIKMINVNIDLIKILDESCMKSSCIVRDVVNVVDVIVNIQKNVEHVNVVFIHVIVNVHGFHDVGKIEVDINYVLLLYHCINMVGN